MTQSIRTTTYHNFNQCPLIAHRLGYAMTSSPENSLESLKQNSSKITITTNNPYYLRTLTNRNIQ